MSETTDNNKSATDKVISRVIEDEMKKAYLDYSMSVIVGRALPDVRDGLKPVHRRILYAMHDTGMKHNSAYKKCARIVGEVLGKYHPHGDQAVYDALVRMAQDFSLRKPLVDGQGNFGSVDGDSAASMRYTEARLSKISSELLADIEKETVDWRDNFDDSLKEPTVLPSKFASLLVNGSTGIAVGMATNIPPHNISEVSHATIKLIDNPDISDAELFDIVKGPDFPTGAKIVGKRGILEAFGTGRGKVTLHSVVSEEEYKNSKRLIVTEIPYMVNKAMLLQEIASQVKDKKIEGISDLRDESDRKGMRIVIELKRDANPDIVKNQLFKFTRMQDTFGIIFLCLVDNVPKVLSLRGILIEYISHRKVVIRRRTEFDLRKAEEKAHILEGLLIALQDIDNVIALIRGSESVQLAKSNLIENFNLSEVQAQSILEMRLQKLAKLEHEKIQAEFDELQISIKRFREILADEGEISRIIKEEQLEIIQNYGDERKTEILDIEDEDLLIEDLITPEDVVVTLSNEGYVKRMPLDTYKVQHRGGKGVIGADSKEEDFISKVFIANTHSYLLVFTDKGKVYWLKVFKIPEGSRYSKGKAIINLIEIERDEKINAIVPVKEFVDGEYLIIATQNGIVKKSELLAYSRPRKGGIIACTLDDNDKLVTVALTDGSKEIMLCTKNGMAARFHEKDARSIGRTSRGVRGITLKGDDKVVAMIIVDDTHLVLTLTTLGYGKMSKVSEYRLINRGGKGVTNMKLSSKNGKVSAVKSVTGAEDLMLITKEGMVVRISLSEVSVLGRSTQGVRVIKTKFGDELVSAAKIVSEDSDVEEQVSQSEE